MNVSINGSPQLTDENRKAVAEKWQNTKKRRQVTERALKVLKFEHLADDDEADGPMELVPNSFTSFAVNSWEIITTSTGN